MDGTLGFAASDATMGTGDSVRLRNRAWSFTACLRVDGQGASALGDVGAGVSIGRQGFGERECL